MSTSIDYISHKHKEGQNVDLTEKTKNGERSNVRANYSPCTGSSLTDHYFSS